MRQTDRALIATGRVSNDSDLAAEDVVLMWGQPRQPGAHDLPAKLLGFSRVSLAAKESVLCEVTAPLWALARFDARRDVSVIDPVEWEFSLQDGERALVHAMTEWSQR